MANRDDREQRQGKNFDEQAQKSGQGRKEGEADRQQGGTATQSKRGQDDRSAEHREGGRSGMDIEQERRGKNEEGVGNLDDEGEDDTEDRE